MIQNSLSDSILPVPVEIAVVEPQVQHPDHDQTLDVTEYRCPMPLLKTRQALRHMESGQTLMVIATDAGSLRDIPAWVRQSAHELVHSEEQESMYHFWITVGEHPDV